MHQHRFRSYTCCSCSHSRHSRDKGAGRMSRHSQNYPRNNSYSLHKIHKHEAAMAATNELTHTWSNSPSNISYGQHAQTPHISTPLRIQLLIALSLGIVIIMICSYYIRRFALANAQQKTQRDTHASTNATTSCAHGVYALWNDLGPTHQSMCCRSPHILTRWKTSWCKHMINGDTCMFDEQCISQHCSPGMTSESRCTNKPDYDINWHDIEGRRPPFMHHTATLITTNARTHHA
jgi:hypothetical protein